LAATTGFVWKATANLLGWPLSMGGDWISGDPAGLTSLLEASCRTAADAAGFVVMSLDWTAVDDWAGLSLKGAFPLEGLPAAAAGSVVYSLEWTAVDGEA